MGTQTNVSCTPFHLPFTFALASADSAFPQLSTGGPPSKKARTVVVFPAPKREVVIGEGLLSNAKFFFGLKTLLASVVQEVPELRDEVRPLLWSQTLSYVSDLSFPTISQCECSKLICRNWQNVTNGFTDGVIDLNHASSAPLSCVRLVNHNCNGISIC